MFNFETIQNVTNVRTIESIDVKVFANSKIRIGEDAKALLGLPEKNVLIVKDSAGNLAIAGVGKTEGRAVSVLGDFSHQALSGYLGGKDSEWKIKKETPMTHPHTGDLYYSLEQVIDGSKTNAEEKAEIEAEEISGLRAEIADEITEDSVIEEANV